MDRAWIEVKKDAYEKNIQELKRFIPEDTQIMAVVKGNAYGHGAAETAKYLNGLGIRAFAVATLSEGIELRKSGVRGLILILGSASYTHLDVYKRQGICGKM